MKREFLQNFKIGKEGLPKEIVDAIMEENGKDINAAKAAGAKPYANYEAILAENTQLKQAGVLAEGKTAAQWKELHDQTVKEYEKQMDSVVFGNMVEAAISRMGGRNVKAISALLDLSALQASENRQEAICSAIRDLQKQEGYLFGTQTPPPYARGTGTQREEINTAPASLAGALREKFERK